MKHSFILRGNGVFFVPSPDTAETNDADSPSESVGLNFNNVGINEFVQSVLGETLGVNYVIDPEISGTINVQTSKPIAKKDLLKAFENILELNGVALVRDGDYFQILPLSKASQFGLVPNISRRGRQLGPGYSIRVVPLRYVSASDMQRLLEPFQVTENLVLVDEDRNLLALSGTSRELDALISTIESFDVDWLAGRSIGIFPLENVGASFVIKELTEIYELESGPTAGVIKLTPIERLNAVLVISKNETFVDEIAVWIRRLDQSDAAGRRLFVYYPQNVVAEDLAETLNEVFRESPERTRNTADDSPIAPGLDAVRLESDSLLNEIDSAPRGGIEFSESNNIRIIADDKNDALLVLATENEYRMIEATLKKLDVVPLQVLIEATIAEVTLGDELRLGLQWFFKTGNFGFPNGDGRAILSSGSSAALSPTFPGFSYILSDPDGPRVILDLLESVTTVNVVSSPQLVVLDNQTADLQVGDEVPIVTQQQQGTNDPDARIVNNIDYLDTGVILKVSPRVKAGGLVTLRIEQEVSNVSETVDSGVLTPTISQRRIASSVAVQSGETVVLGGLITDSRTKTNAGIPIMSRLPGIGPLFGSKEKTNRRTELMVFLTPRVIRNSAEARAITQEVRERLEGLKELEEFDGFPFLQGDSQVQ